MTEEEIAVVLREGYAIDKADVTILSGEVATVCRVRADGADWALKSMPGSASEGQLARWQAEAVRTLSDQGLPVSAVRPTNTGELVHRSRVQGTDIHSVLSSWLPDPPLSDVLIDSALLRAVGRLAARVSAALELVPPPPVPVSHLWELHRTADSIRSVLPGVRDPAIAHLATHAADLFDQHARPVLSRLPRQVVHHDLHDANLLVGTAADGAADVTGVLDFGDMVEAPRVAELVVAATYAARHTHEPATAIVDVARGWQTQRSLSQPEMAVLLPGAQARLALNAAVWASRLTGQRAAYATSRLAGTVEALSLLLEVKHMQFIARLGARDDAQ